MGRAQMTNPLDQDPVLKDLLKQLDRIETRRGFAKWKKHFLAQFESHLEGMSITRAGRSYHAFAKRLDRLVLLLKALEQLMSIGDLSAQKVTVKSRQSLTELQKQLTEMIAHLQALVPGTLEQENNAGYTKFDMGAALVRDGFVEYDRLCLCRDVLWHMRAALLLKVADRQLLEEMERYRTHLEVFCGIMGKDLGLHGAMLKCRDILRAEDDAFFQYENGENNQQRTPRRFESIYDQEGEDDDDDESASGEEEEEEDEEEDDDESSSSESNLIEIYGMEIPLRLSQPGEKYLSTAESDNVSDISDDSSWSWQLSIPEPPHKNSKKLDKPAPGALPPPPLFDEEEAEEEDNDSADDEKVDHNEDQNTLISSQPVVESPSRRNMVRQRIVRAPTGPSPVLSVNMPPRKPVPTFPDAEPTQPLHWKMSDYYHGGANESWRVANNTKTRREPLIKTTTKGTISGSDSLDTESMVSDGPKKIVLKARLRRKTHSSASSGSEEDGNRSLDSVVLRGKSALRGGKKSSADGAAAAAASNESPAGDNVPASSSFSEGERESKSMASDKSTASELDSVRHSRRPSLRNKSASSSSLGTARRSRSRSRSRSNELQRMARAATNLKSADDDASTGSRRSRKSLGSRSQSSRRKKKDPLHNLLFKKSPSTIVVHHNNNKDLASLVVNIDNANSTEEGKPEQTDANNDADYLDSTPSPKGRMRNADDDYDSSMTDGDNTSNVDLEERRELIYTWYDRLGKPTKDAFKRRIRQADKEMMDGLSEEDVDLLPWIHNGARIDRQAMGK